jgi:DNA topoisomerase VI subunit A
MSSFDYAKFHLSSAVVIKLNDKDIDRARQMKAYAWFKDKKWQREIDALLANGFKMELDGLLTKTISFISEEYIPKKLRERDYLQ